MWEPSLIDSLIDAGIDYTVVDDTHFIYGGLSEDDLDGYYLTENEGRILKIFPGSMRLRYLVPFRPIEESLQYLKQVGPVSLRVLADDGEKFGVWPQTFEHVYDRGWLDNFLIALETTGIKTLTFSEALKHLKPKGRIYLPCASYEEMGEWVLNPENHEKFENLKKRCSQDEKAFIQGGYFKNFLVKYPEINIMHKRMIYISKHLDENPEARLELWRGQASCAYWHGIFGGLYLSHLREAVYEHLIASDNIGLKFDGFKRLDFDCDGEDEVIFSNDFYFIVFKPLFGAMIEFDLRPKLINLINILTRRSESYHKKVIELTRQNLANGSVKSIHDVMKTKESSLDQHLIYDPYQRYAFIDFIDGEILRYDDYSIQDQELQFKSRRLLKTIRLTKNNISLKYQSEKISGPLDFEISLGLFEDNIEIDSQIWDKKREGLLDSKSLSIVNHDRKFQISWQFDGHYCLRYYPIETVSMSESGIERNYQGTAFRFHFETLPSLDLRIECS